MEQYLLDQNQLHIFDNDNFSKSCKNADLSAVDNFFDNIAHPYLWVNGCLPEPSFKTPGESCWD